MRGEGESWGGEQNGVERGEREEGGGGGGRKCSRPGFLPDR